MSSLCISTFEKKQQAVMGVFTNRPYILYQFYDITMQFWSSFSQDSFGYSAVVPFKF